MKYLTLLIFFISISVLAQNSNKIPYLPQEELLLQECSSSENTRLCTEQLMLELVNDFVQNELIKVAPKKISKDTITSYINLEVLENGTINKEKTSIYINGYKETKEDSLLLSLEEEVFKMPAFEVINPKSEQYTSYHYFKFPFLVEKSDSQIVKIEPLEITDPYKGGVILEIPKFQECKKLITNKEGRICFNQQMRKHIQEHFKYPKRAQDLGVQGKVYILFSISKSGKPINIRTRSPHPLLSDEAIRIIKKLPKIIPGKQNGKPVKIPFSIPINFKLQ